MKSKERPFTLEDCLDISKPENAAKLKARLEQSRGTTIIIVHPFFSLGGGARSPVNPYKEFLEQFKSVFRRTINLKSTPIILLIEENVFYLDFPIQKALKEADPEQEIFVVPTEMRSVTPLYDYEKGLTPEEEKIASSFDKAKDPRNIRRPVLSLTLFLKRLGVINAILGGELLWQDAPDEPHMGCLGTLNRFLQFAGIKTKLSRYTYPLSEREKGKKE